MNNVCLIYYLYSIHQHGKYTLSTYAQVFVITANMAWVIHTYNIIVPYTAKEHSVPQSPSCVSSQYHSTSPQTLQIIITRQILTTGENSLCVCRLNFSLSSHRACPASSLSTCDFCCSDEITPYSPSFINTLQWQVTRLLTLNFWYFCISSFTEECYNTVIT